MRVSEKVSVTANWLNENRVVAWQKMKQSQGSWWEPDGERFHDSDVLIRAAGPQVDGTESFLLVGKKMFWDHEEEKKTNIYLKIEVAKSVAVGCLLADAT